MPNTIKVHSDSNQLSFSVMRTLILQEAEQHELRLLEDTNDFIQIASPLGKFGISVKGTGFRLHIEASDEKGISLIRNELMTHLEYYAPELIKRLRWSDNLQDGQTPPNFQFATVLSQKSLNEDFIRLEIQLEQPELFTSASFHFRFLLPAVESIEPEWPILLENGTTQWPKGDQALHRPAYTAQHINAEKGIITVDIFNHKGGKIYAWAKQLQTPKKIAIMGPGGDGALKEKNVILCGDETAYPAIAHILRTLPNNATAEIILLSHSHSQDYPMPNINGANLKWVNAESQPTLAEHAFTAIQAKPDHYLWFSANNREVAKLRKLSKPLKLNKKKTYLAAFWNVNK